jgi:hypothetical protein
MGNLVGKKYFNEYKDIIEVVSQEVRFLNFVYISMGGVERGGQAKHVYSAHTDWFLRAVKAGLFKEIENDEEEII